MSFAQQPQPGALLHSTMQYHPESNGSQLLHGVHQTAADGIGLRSLNQTGTAEAVPMHHYDQIPQETSASFGWDNRVSGNDRSMGDIETAACDAVLREQVCGLKLVGF